MRLLKSEALALVTDSSHFVMIFFKKGYDIELAYEAGLLSRNEENFSYYDRFLKSYYVSFEKCARKNC